MKLTIIPVDGSVGEDGKFYINLDLASCNIPSDVHALQWDGMAGSIEFNTPIPNQDITTLPNWAIACSTLWDAKDYEEKHPPAPTPEQIIAENKQKAESLLAESDWAALPDVPLQNKAQWETYRAELRQIAIIPTLNPTWPTKPEEIW